MWIEDTTESFTNSRIIRRERRKEARKEAVHLSSLPYFTLDDALSPHDYQKPFKLAP